MVMLPHRISQQRKFFMIPDFEPAHFDFGIFLRKIFQKFFFIFAMRAAIAPKKV